MNVFTKINNNNDNNMNTTNNNIDTNNIFLAVAPDQFSSSPHLCLSLFITLFAMVGGMLCKSDKPSIIIIRLLTQLVSNFILTQDREPDQ